LIFGILLKIVTQNRQTTTAQLQIFAKRGWPTSRDPYKIWYTRKHISETSKATDLKFGLRMHMNNFSKTDKFSEKGAWPGSRDPYKIWHSLKHICKTRKATDFKFGVRVHVNNFSKIETKM